MFVMIYVNDLDEDKSPPWMKHFHGPNGMTFVDLVFPAFLFIVGMAIPIAMNLRLSRGESPWKLLLHVLVRSVSLLAIGILMVNAERGPDGRLMGWGPMPWTALMFISSVLAFCSISPPTRNPSPHTRSVLRIVTVALRVCGIAGMIWLALAYRGKHGRILTLSPFSISTDWYGILGMIGWAYLVASIAYLIFRNHRTALLGCVVLLMGLFAAEHNPVRHGPQYDFWLSQYVNVGVTLGSQGAIAVAGVILGTILLTADTASLLARARFTLLFSAGFAAAALLVYYLWGISKNAATPSWCLWSCAITAGLWFLFYLLADVLHFTWFARPWAIAGQNVLLAYLISEMMESVFSVLHIGDWYDNLSEPDLAHAIGRSIGAAIAVLCLTALLNRVGFRLKL